MEFYECSSTKISLTYNLYTIQSLGKEYIAGIFESSDILLSESQKTAIIQEIDTDSDGLITKQELETYLKADTANSILALSRICL